MGQLQAENYSLRQQLEALLFEARCNEDKMRRFDQIERRLIGAPSLVELVRLLLSEYKAAFGVDASPWRSSIRNTKRPGYSRGKPVLPG